MQCVDNIARSAGAAAVEGAGEAATKKLKSTVVVLQKEYDEIAKEVIVKLKEKFTVAHNMMDVVVPQHISDRISRLIVDALRKNKASCANEPDKFLYIEEIFKAMQIYCLTIDKGWVRSSKELKLKDDLAGLDGDLNTCISMVRENVVAQANIGRKIESNGLDGTRELVYAVLNGCEKEVQKLLFGGGYQVETITILDGPRHGWPLLCSVIWDNQVTIARHLLNYRKKQPIKTPLDTIKMPSMASDDDEDWSKWNLLMCAVRWDYTYVDRPSVHIPLYGNPLPKKKVFRDSSEMVALLLEHEAEPNQSMPNGQWKNWSLLGFALWNVYQYPAYESYKKMAISLLAKGADDKLRIPGNNKQGWKSEDTLRDYIDFCKLDVKTRAGLG